MAKVSTMIESVSISMLSMLSGSAPLLVYMESRIRKHT